MASFRAKLERLDKLGTEVTLGLQDHLESKVCLDQQAKKVPRCVSTVLVFIIRFLATNKPHPSLFSGGLEDVPGGFQWERMLLAHVESEQSFMRFLVSRVIQAPWGILERVALLGAVGSEAVEACQAPRYNTPQLIWSCLLRQQIWQHALCRKHYWEYMSGVLEANSVSCCLNYLLCLCFFLDC